MQNELLVVDTKIIFCHNRLFSDNSVGTSQQLKISACNSSLLVEHKLTPVHMKSKYERGNNIFSSKTVRICLLRVVFIYVVVLMLKVSSLSEQLDDNIDHAAMTMSY